MPSITIIAWHNDSIVDEEDRTFEVRRVPSNAKRRVIKALIRARGFINVRTEEEDVVVGFDEHKFDYESEVEVGNLTGLATLKKLLAESLPGRRIYIFHKWDYSLRDMMLGLALTEDERRAFSY